MSYFGTDGIRGTFGQLPITPDFLLRLGFVAGQALAKTSDHRPSVLIGKDTRLSGYVIEAALQAGFNASGVDVHMLGVLPTPAIAHLTKSFHADLGVVISASHNPYTDNGVKFFDQNGKKISDQLQNAINSHLDQLIGDDGTMNALPYCADALGKNHRIDDAVGRYIEFCKGVFPYRHSLRGMTIAVDCANGATYKIAPRVFAELGAKVISLFDSPNGANINDGCGSTHPKALQALVKEQNIDLGIALDGDGDRLILVDSDGTIVDGDGILYVLASFSNPSGVVGTLMSNMALELALKARDIDFVRSQVGDRYVMQALAERGWTLGGEPSGHILTLDKAGTGDAIVAAVQVLSIITQTGKSLKQLMGDYSPMPQTLINVRLNDRQDPYANDELATYLKAIEKTLGDKGRLLVRKSGTEPLIRVMVECQDHAQAQHLAGEVADKIKAVLG